jgi:hypothetical protein
MLSATQLKYIELDRKRQEYKKILEDYKETVGLLVKEHGLNSSFQDADGIVYLVSPCEGRYVTFDKYEVKRTKREGERAGSLALTKAKELGYNV